MRLTRSQLLQIIKEEVENAKVDEAKFSEAGSLEDISAFDLVDFAEAYVRLSPAVQEQLTTLLNDPSAPINYSAVEMIHDRLAPFNKEIREVTESWLADYNDE